ncbi:helix-turn-helix domain-containing protein [Streptomyces goshikiensis]|uniref:IclR family transcriptional regulator n=1 Tax=Streptomyces goshikiensis TaxID=1942 RepID=UPI0022F3EA1F|nr:IclR family transcriptional regulator C-terminal domain-containing protein [Streptomyces goshikiensis]WBY23510.1 helix-turn-helix domain-containing protein [Streptomyces goshikiensis]WSS02407.1 helix-turn-helix domain-containing protein [Streptomyces goshikiensis]WSX96370.1 helix-turn-helix domain-containing protein [Streptomyces goshikiensis]
MPHTGPQSVDRALEILDAVADAPGPVSAKSLARRVGCSLSTAYHLLAPLAARGYVVRTARGYVPGPRVPLLHRSFLRHLEPAPRMTDLLARLRRTTGAEAYYTAYRGGLITVVDTTAPVTDTANPFAPGRETRAHATAHGKALLAELPGPALRRYLTEHGMARLTPATITSADGLERELSRVRGQGFAVSVGEADPSYTCLAVALPRAGGDGAVHALSVSLPTEEFRRRPEGIRAALADAAAAVS